MQKTLQVFLWTCVSLITMDLAVSAVLNVAERSGKADRLVQYFDYGRSIPGKLEEWADTPGSPRNLRKVAWRPDMIKASAAAFAQEASGEGPVVRSYGMSFVDNILRAAVKLKPDLLWDSHAGPGAPPNFTYTIFEDDRANRKPGDIVVLGLLSSAVPAMAALSNRTWVFEQPAPFTYPIYQPDGEGLKRIDPLVESLSDEVALATDSIAAEAWRMQLVEEDLFYSLATFGAPFLDHSPFLRLLRRSLGTSHIDAVKNEIVRKGAYPYAVVLERITRQFIKTAKADGLVPFVMLIQSNDPNDADLRAILQPVLQKTDVAYLATADVVSPDNPAAFLPDRHFRPDIDERLASLVLSALFEK
jgi:hypothetical protein